MNFSEREQSRRIAKPAVGTLTLYLANNPDAPALERVVIEQFIQDPRMRGIPDSLNHALRLTPPLTHRSVRQILGRALGRYDYYEHPSRLTQRSLEARRALAEAEEGSYTNDKAKATEGILYLRSIGYTRVQIMDQLGLHLNHYKALIKEAFEELKYGIFYGTLKDAPELGNGSLVNGSPGTKRSTDLLTSYRSYRQKLGESVTQSGELTATLLSLRETAILREMAEGADDEELSKNFFNGHFKMYAGIVADWLVGNKGFFTYEQRLEERQEILAKFREDLTQDGVILPKKLLSVDGFSTLTFLELLAQGKTYSEIAQIITQTRDRTILPWKLEHHMARIKAFYKHLRTAVFSQSQENAGENSKQAVAEVS